MNSRKTSTSVSLTIQKALTLWITTNWKILKEVGIANHLICLLRNLYAGQEATIRTLHRTADWFKIGKGVCHACTLSPCLFSLYAELFLFSCPVMSDCDPMCFSMPGLPVPHHLLKIAQVHVYCFRDAIYSSCPLLPSSPSAFNLSQHQEHFQRVSCSYQPTKNTGVSASASVLPVNFQD